MYKILKTFNTLSEVVIVDHDGKVEVIAYTDDASDPAEETAIINKLQTAFNIKLEK
jgi:hypothetical protein